MRLLARLCHIARHFLGQCRWRQAGTFVLLTLAACTPAAPRTLSCDATPNSTRSVNGHELIGKANRDVFLFPTDHVLRSERSGPEKLLVVLARIPEPAPSEIEVVGENTSTGTRRTFSAGRHFSEYGTEWGTNFNFPEAGCWHLSVRESGNEGEVVVEVE
jgi:hypothetical protein